MSRTETFFSRWSRRKRAAAGRPPEPDKPAAAPVETPAPEPPAAAEVPLPPIESIQAATDLKPFLAPTVPAELTRAALRRAWTADPAIRDFVGLSENAWDFTAPDGVPGFGSVTLDDVRRLVADMTQPANAPESERRTSPTAATEPGPPPSSPERPADPGRRSAASETDQREPTTTAPTPGHRHGGALPT